MKHEKCYNDLQATVPAKVLTRFLLIITNSQSRLEEVVESFWSAFAIASESPSKFFRIVVFRKIAFSSKPFNTRVLVLLPFTVTNAFASNIGRTSSFLSPHVLKYGPIRKDKTFRFILCDSGKKLTSALRSCVAGTNSLRIS